MIRLYRYILLIVLFLSKLQAEEAIKPATLGNLQTHIQYDPSGQNRIGYIAIDNRSQGISESTWLYVKTALEYYKKNRPIFILLNLNTPGGEVFAAQKISDALKDLDTQENIPVIAFVNNWAISAGAMIAYSCRFIVATSDASMGAAEPILIGESGEMQTASEKINSALRSDFASRARFFGRNSFIAEAMMDKDLILVQRDGKIIKLDLDSQIHTAEPNPDMIISPKGKLLTLSADQMLEYGVADMIFPPTKLPPITATEKETGQWPADRLALFHQPFFNKIPATIDQYQMDWKTQFFVFLAHPVVSSLLVLGLMVGFYLEINTPGFGLPGTIALLSLFFIALSSLSLEIANWLELILLLVGILILLVEIFLLPTFGLLGIFGLVFFVAGLLGMLLPEIGDITFDFDTQTLNAAGIALLARLAWLSGTLLLGLIIIGILSRYVTPKAMAWSKLVLTGSEQEGYAAGVLAKDLPQPGTEGKVFATLRPAGKVIIGQMIYDALTDGSFIEKDTPIIVSSIDGSTLVVRPKNMDADHSL